MDSTTEEVINDVREIAAAMGLSMHPNDWGTAAQVQRNVMLRKMAARFTLLANALLQSVKMPNTENTGAENGLQDAPEMGTEQVEISSTEDNTAESDRIWFNPENLEAKQ